MRRVDPSQVRAIIFRSLDMLNAEQPADRKVLLDRETPLFGPQAQIDSLSLVSLVVDVESDVNSEFGVEVSLTDDRAMMREVSPFLSVATLEDYICELLGENRG